MNHQSSERYDHKTIEPKWQEIWEKNALYRTTEDTSKKKCYVLDMFPYPSGDGLHVGHPKGYIATDVYSRYKRMSGYNVLHPMGWDAFGLPAEQYALANKVHPRAAVEKNCNRFKEQLQKIGFNYDWEREINTTDPAYYKWTQWIFVQLFKKGLAYQSFEPINWCPSCMTGLANEDLDGDSCERCGTRVEQKPIRQWILRITDYADRMLEDLDELSWPESIKESQRNWIGRSEGALLHFPLKGAEEKISVFTTRPDTLYGVTYVAIGHKEYTRLQKLGHISPNATLDSFVKQIEQEESDGSVVFGEVAEKKGMDTGTHVVHPITGVSIPLWVANYVLSTYGTGAVMAVPAHDERDFAFASKYGLPLVQVISQDAKIHELKEAYTGDGILVNSEEFSGEENRKSIPSIISKAKGEPRVQYRLKDWVFARQRYWGEPIPIVFDMASGNAYPVDESTLPVALPSVDSYEPTGTGESPLANIHDWVEVSGYITDHGTFIACTQSEAPSSVSVKVFRRETNTMPQWAGSSWYYLRYIDPKNDHSLVGSDKEKYWSPVDLYVGGAEHATRHLIYARFWHKFLFDLGVVSKKEPFARLFNVGLIMASDGRKMSKRYGNVVNPDQMIEIFGADALRVYEMFMGPFDQSISWSTDNMVGARRFIERIFRLKDKVKVGATVSNEIEILRHQTIAKVGDDIENFKFNTAISQMMIFVNAIEGLSDIPDFLFKDLVLLIAPFAPHISEELWHGLGGNESVHTSLWPVFDKTKLVSDTVVVAISVGGKLRDTISVKRGLSREDLEKIALSQDGIKKWIPSEGVKKVIVVPDKIVNIVI